MLNNPARPWETKPPYPCDNNDWDDAQDAAARALYDHIQEHTDGAIHSGECEIPRGDVCPTEHCSKCQYWKCDKDCFGCDIEKQLWPEGRHHA